MHTESIFNDAKLGGKLPNTLGLLTEDHRSLRPHRLLEITGLSKTGMAEELSISRPLVYKKQIDLKAFKKLHDRIVQIVFVTDLAFELFKYNDTDSRNLELSKLAEAKRAHIQHETEKWLMSPSHILFGKSPFQACLSGHGNIIVEWLQEKLGVKINRLK